MKANEEKLKRASEAEIIREISLVNDEINDDMYPVSYYRFKQLSDYKKILEEELQKRLK
jgi:hypothetical protein